MARPCRRQLRKLVCLTGWSVSILYDRGAEPKVERLRLADRQMETIASLKDLRRVVDSMEDTQINLAPDGSPVLARDIGSQEIYALNIRWP
jgi:hypothetical protein